MHFAAGIGTYDEHLNHRVNGTANSAGRDSYLASSAAVLAIDKTGIQPWDEAILDESRRVARSKQLEEKAAEDTHEARWDPGLELGTGSKYTNDGKAGQPDCTATNPDITACTREAELPANINSATQKRQAAIVKANMQEKMTTWTQRDTTSGKGNDERKADAEEVRRSRTPGRREDAQPQRRKRQRVWKGLESARDFLNRCLDVDGAHAKAYALRAEIEGRLGGRERAIADFEAAAVINIGDIGPRINQVKQWV